MRKLGLVLSLLATLGLCLPWVARAENTTGPSNLIICNKVAIMESGGTGLAVIIPVVAGQAISICGWNVTNSGASGTIAFVYGTQTTTPCDTGARKASPTFSVSSTSPNQAQTQYATQSGGTGQALCANPSAATFSALVWYAQF